MKGKKYLNGPDQVLPASNLTTTRADEPVRLRIPQTGTTLETRAPISVPSFFKRTVKLCPDHPALAYKTEGKWSKITYWEYLEQVKICAKGFLKLGLERYHSVCILGFNSPEWFIADLGAIFAGGIAVGIYVTNSSEECFRCADCSKANVIVVQDQKQLDKIVAVKAGLTHLKAIVQYEGRPTHPGVISWSELMAIGRQQPDKELDQILKRMGVNECCTMLFTPGTIGKPKAVLLSHDNLTSCAVASFCHTDGNLGEVLVSYLPPSHIVTQAMDIYLAIINAACVYFADPDALQGTLINTLREAQPTMQLVVPTVWEIIHEKLVQMEAESSAFKKMLLSWAKHQGLLHHLGKINGVERNSWGYNLANYLVFKKIKHVLGLSRCNAFGSGTASLSAETKKYLLSFDIPISEGYALSEASGIHAFCGTDAFSLEAVGTTLPGFQTKISNGEGEIWIYGRHICMGYLDSDIKNIDEEGWLHTGDAGRVDDKGFLYVTGRLKELLISEGGATIPPVPIEQLVKTELPHVNHALLVGDGRKFLTILLTLKSELDPDTNEPLDTLLPSVQEWLASLGCPAGTVSKVLKEGPHSKLLHVLKDAIDRVNHKAESNAQRIQKLAILPADFSVATGELGPTLNVRRSFVGAKYADIIDRMYR